MERSDDRRRLPSTKMKNLWTVFRYVLLTLVILEAFGCGLILRYVPYTEIDWKAYMSQVELFQNGEWDYINLKGGTGPLVYPAAFVYIYSALYYFTNDGLNIFTAQSIFVALYLLNLVVVLGIYYRTRVTPVKALVLLCLSKRIHSIFILRLFNDAIAMLLLYISVYCFLRQRWKLGSLVFSTAVGVKMNILLFAPGLLLLMLQSSGVYKTIGYLTICAGWQLFLASPFLYWNWYSYMSKAFEFSRVFMYKWTVNWKIVQEPIFVSKPFALVLLLCHILTLTVFLAKMYRRYSIKLRMIRPRPIQTQHIATTLFVSNFIGICFSRTLHYQFYSWYFHTIPYLLWKATVLKSDLVRLCLFAGVEFAFNVYPSTPLSSAVLQMCHGILLVAVLVSVFLPTGGGGSSSDDDIKKYDLPPSDLDASTRESLLREINEKYELERMIVRFSSNGLTAEDVKGATAVSIDEFEFFVRLPKTGEVVTLDWGPSYSPLTSVEAVHDALCALQKASSSSSESTSTPSHHHHLRRRKTDQS